MTASNLENNPIKPEEDKIIRGLAEIGWSSVMISDDLKAKGFKRGADTVRMYMWKKNIRPDPLAAIAVDQARRAAGNGRGGGVPDTYISPFEANELFRQAFALGSEGRMYDDHPLASRGKDALTMRRPSATGWMTTGGVAVYA